MRFYHILTLKHMIKFQKINFIYIDQSLQNREWKIYYNLAYKPKRMRVQLSQEFLQNKIFITEDFQHDI